MERLAEKPKYYWDACAWIALIQQEDHLASRRGQGRPAAVGEEQRQRDQHLDRRADMSQQV